MGDEWSGFLKAPGMDDPAVWDTIHDSGVVSSITAKCAKMSKKCAKQLFLILRDRPNSRRRKQKIFF